MNDDICQQCRISVRKYPDLYHTGGPRGACEVALYRDNTALRAEVEKWKESRREMAEEAARLSLKLAEAQMRMGEYVEVQAGDAIEILPAYAELRSQLSARDAEVEQEKERSMEEIEAVVRRSQIHFEAMQVERDDLRSQLSARDAEVRALRAYAQHSGTWCSKDMGHACTCGLDALLTGEPGPGGEG